MNVRPATTEDAADIARIYNQAIADRASTFETRPRTAEDIFAWFDGIHPIIVVEDQGKVIGYAASFLYRPRECYRGVAEFSVYIDRTARKRGAGRLALTSLVEACEKAGFWKLVSRIFPENTGIRKLNRALGVREVGLYEKHAQLDGIWRDVIIVEKLIASNIKK
jgi:phosphinothricin acetyltransferase